MIVIDAVKKSKESHVHPKKPAANMSHWWEVNSRRMATGFLNLFYFTPSTRRLKFLVVDWPTLGGLRLDKRVEKYRTI